MSGSDRRVQARDEVPFYFTAGQERLFGVLTAPAATDSRSGILLLQGGVYVLSTNRNRSFVRLARRLAGLGHWVMRIDFRGVGESTGIISGYALDDPNVCDVSAALDCLEAAGVDQIAVVGSCFGARAGLQAACEHPLLSAVVLFSPPLGDAGLGEAPTPDRIGTLFSNQITTIWRRRIPTLFIYGENDPSYQDFKMASAATFAPLFGQDSPFGIKTLAGHAHTLQRVSIQNALIEEIVEWFAQLSASSCSDALGRARPRWRSSSGR